MASWTNLLNALFVSGKPILGSTGVALRDNLVAYMERDSSVPAAYQPIMLLGTITTTSGTTVSLSGLDLTSYKFLRLVINGVSLSVAAKFRFNGVEIVDFATGGEAAYGIIDIDLSTGVFGAMTGRGVPGTNPSAGGLSGVTNSSTLVTFTVSSGSFDAGSIKVYGIK